MLLALSECFKKSNAFWLYEEIPNAFSITEWSPLLLYSLMAEENGYAVPVIYYMLGIIFNEAEHINGFEIEQNKERSCVYRLDNGVIHQMAIELFDYKGNDITIDAIL